MEISFSTALITGNSRGLGRAIAVKLAQEGVHRIAVHYLTRRNEAEKTLALLRDAGAEGVLVQGDTSNAQRAREIVDEAARDLGGCDIFVQSVAPQLDEIYEHTLATEVPLEKWQLAFDTQARAFLSERAQPRSTWVRAAEFSPCLTDRGTNRWLAAVGRYGFGQGGTGEYLQV